MNLFFNWKSISWIFIWSYWLRNWLWKNPPKITSVKKNTNFWKSLPWTGVTEYAADFENIKYWNKNQIQKVVNLHHGLIDNALTFEIPAWNIKYWGKNPQIMNVVNLYRVFIDNAINYRKTSKFWNKYQILNVVC